MRSRTLGRLRRSAGAVAALLVSAGLAKSAETGSADLAPMVSPDRVDDAPANERAVVANFAWRAFIALNWPSLLDAPNRGVPDRHRALGDSGERVWETFKSDYELFAVGDDGRRVAPEPWGSYAGRNPCGPSVDNWQKTIASFAPFADFNQPSFAVGAPANPLVARNGAYTRYEIHFNEAEFSAFAASGWSRGLNLPDNSRPARFPIGSIAVKAAWRPLTAADPPAVRARAYIERAEIVDTARTLAAGRAVCSASDVALVGLHIAIKTKSRPQWIWSTFEHVDNVPPVGEAEAREPDARDAGAPYAYFDPSRPRNLWPPFGSPAALPVDWTNPPKRDPAPMQVVRRHPIDPAVMAVNRVYWSLPGVRGTVWEHYMLVAVQWPTSGEAPGPANDGAPFPSGTASGSKGETYKSTAAPEENVVNTTMETYLQDRPSSCMACHQAVSNARGGDFVATLAAVR
ncbi:MAG TPA: hypothetical protein VFE63_16830 [Roseiarcus sp.]|nr:hypothetical protein [Roseiarcus sp.]